ncbi:MAG: YgjP-like metallopeptidase domain-containing protein [Candidatus Methanosuratincola verstraetei]|jgi:predicted metal-dependent hydrolase
MAKSINVNGLEIRYETVRRNIRYPRLEYKTGSLVLVLPKDAGEEEVLERYRDWIFKRELEIREALRRSASKRLELEKGFREFKDFVDGFAKKISAECGFRFEKITYRKMRTKWASFSQKRTLTVNPLLRHLPQRYVEYVIFHELVHSVEKRHNEKFWRLIKERFNDYQEIENDLFSYWFAIQRKEGGDDKW